MFDTIRGLGLTSNTFYLAGIASVFLSIAMWVVRRQDADRAAAERFGIFIGLWAPTLMVMGKVLDDDERRGMENGSS